MTYSFKAFAIWLPLLALLSILGWIVLGAMPGARFTGDILAWLAELPVITCHAAAAGGACVLGMHITGMNIDNVERSRLMERAANGDAAALRLLQLETFAWLAHLAFWSLFFFPHW
jgi:hypothetical protein